MTATSQVGTRLPRRLEQIPFPSSQDSEFNISVSNLPEKLGFSAELQAELEAVVGNLKSLALKL